MNQEQLREEEERFYSEQGAERALEHDKTILALLTGIIAGLAALLLYKEVGFWSASFLALGMVWAATGLAFCVIHMLLTSKIMFLYAALCRGDETVPDIARGQESTALAVVRSHYHAQKCYFRSLVFFFLSIMSSAFGAGILLWNKIPPAGLAVGAVITLLALWLTGRLTNTLFHRTSFARRDEAQDIDGP